MTDQTPGGPLDPTLDGSGAGDGDAAAVGERPGDVIGRYRLVQRLGEGGFGTVFLAQQQEPLVRQVALKVIKLGMDTRQVIARFEAERQTLALMDHPHIAKVLDAGATDSGRPYFVMELVKGIPITDYCDRNRLDLPRRLRLFGQVCAAVQHAHQKGIIHRDIKPSNVLVSDAGGQPLPKVIDFGIAKATSRHLSDKTAFTQQGLLLGTPEYMSPEQADVSALDIDTRSDIYSLGVLLYELLAGATPFDGRKLRSAGYGEIQRIIREVEPPLPSTRAGSLGALLNEIAGHRQQRGAQLVRDLRGELDWIVMKCLEKDRTRRYETANGLARDVERFLADEPVEASPPSRRYRLKKLVVRNRTAFAAGAAMVLLLTAGVVGTSVGLVRARLAERAAVSEAAKSEQVAGFLTDMLAGVGPSAARGRDTAMLEEILQETQDTISEELAGQPEVEGVIRSHLGTTYYDMGHFEQAIEQFSRARDLLTEAHGERHEDVAKQISNLAMAHDGLQQYDQAEPLYRQALALRSELLGDEHEDTASNRMNLANMLVSLGRYDDAEPLLKAALAAQRALHGEQHEQVATCLNSLGNLMQHLGRLDEAGPYYDQALAIHTATLGADHPFVITDMVNRAWLVYNQGDFHDAAERFGEAAELGRRVYNGAHPNLVQNLKSQARCLQRLGDYEQAEALFHEAWDMSIELSGPDNLNAADVMSDLAAMLGEVGRRQESDELTQRVLDLQREQLGENHPSTLTTLQNYAYSVYSRREFDRAEVLFRESLAAYTQVYGRESKDSALVITNLGRTLRDKGDLAGAEECFVEAGGIRLRVLGPEHLMATVTEHDLARTRVYQGRLDEAAEMFGRVIEGYAAKLDSTHRGVGSTRVELAAIELWRGNYERARDLARDGRRISVQAMGEDDANVLWADLLIAAAQGHLGDRAEATELLDSLALRLAEQKPSKLARWGRYVAEGQVSLGRFAEAEATLQSARDTLTAELGDQHYETQLADDALGRAYAAWAATGSNAGIEKLEVWQAGRP